MITKSDIQDVIVQQMNMISSVESYPREQL